MGCINCLQKNLITKWRWKILEKEIW